MKNILFFSLLFVEILIGSFVQAGTKLAVPDPLKALTQNTTWLNTSRALAIDDLKGRVILLDFWTYCCINCIHVIPDLQNIEEEFKEKVMVIGVHSGKFINEKESDNIRQAIVHYNVTHPVINDSNFAVWDRFRVQAWPTLVVLNANGEVEGEFNGEGQKDKIKNLLNRLTKTSGEVLNISPLPIKLEKEKAAPTFLKYPGKLAYTSDFGGAPALFVSDSGNNRILALRANGSIIFSAGKKDEPGRKDGKFYESRFNNPQGLLYDKGSLYVADTGNHIVRRLDLLRYKVETIAGMGIIGNFHNVKKAPALKAPLNSPWDLAFYPNPQKIVIAMAGLHQLWSYDTKDHTISVIAGDGREGIIDGDYPDNALAQPSGVTSSESRLFFVDSETSSLRVLENTKVKTLIGTGLFNFGFKDGVQGTALLQHPIGIATQGNFIFVADSFNHALRRYDLPSGGLVTISGGGKKGYSDGSLSEAKFNEPNGIALAGDLIYVADTNNSQIRVVDLKNQTVSTLQIQDPETSKLRVTLREEMPNLKKDDPIDVQTEFKFNLQFEKGWHLNDLAPSYLAVFDVSQGKRGKLVKLIERSDLQAGKADVSNLAADHKYRAQGTIYFCQESEGSSCVIQSHDIVLTTKTETGVKEVPLKIEEVKQ